MSQTLVVTLESRVRRLLELQSMLYFTNRKIPPRRIRRKRTTSTMYTADATLLSAAKVKKIVSNLSWNSQNSNCFAMTRG